MTSHTRKLWETFTQDARYIFGIFKKQNVKMILQTVCFKIFTIGTMFQRDLKLGIKSVRRKSNFSVHLKLCVPRVFRYNVMLTNNIFQIYVLLFHSDDI